MRNLKCVCPGGQFQLQEVQDKMDSDRITEHSLFATKLLSIDFPQSALLNEDLYRLLTDEKFNDDFNAHPDQCNLLNLEPTHQCIAALRKMFLEGLERYLRSEDVCGEYTASVVLFPNIARQHEFTVVHNHNADVAGIYYVRTSDSHVEPSIQIAGESYDYFNQDDGALLLHDPRFNANLGYLKANDYVKVFPRPGQMLLFPGYLWHSVLPHRGTFRRLSIGANFCLSESNRSAEYRVSLKVTKA
jgi:Putative 2OG-Fe(II) oxygenase